MWKEVLALGCGEGAGSGQVNKTEVRQPQWRGSTRPEIDTEGSGR